MTASSPLERLADCIGGKFDDEPDWFELISTANDEFVAPVLCRSLEASDAAARAEPEARAYLAELERANQARNRNLWRLVCKTIKGFNAEGVTPTLIKGASEMALMADPSQYSRLLIDVDLLIEPDQLAAVEQAFEQLGFELLADSKYQHSPGSYWCPGTVAAVDLHSSFPQRIACLLSDEDLNARLTLQQRDDIIFRVPDDSLRFLINISHDMIHHTALASGATNLRYLLTLAEQIKDPKTRLDWGWLQSKRHDWRFRLAFDLQLMMLDDLLGVEVPATEPPALVVRLLHWRRLLKFRNPRLGRIEWQVVRYGLSAARVAGMRRSER